MKTSRKIRWAVDPGRQALAQAWPAPCRRGARLAALCCGLVSLVAATAVQADAEPAAEQTPLLLWGVSQGCERSPKLEQALMTHLNRMGERLVGCPALEQAQAQASQPPCSGSECAAQLPSDCKQAPVRLLGAEVRKDKALTQLHIWLTEVRPGAAGVSPRSVDDACVNCDAGSVQELLLHRAGQLIEGRKATSGLCSPQAAPEVKDAGELAAPPVTLLIVNLADKERSVRAAVEPYLTRLGHQLIVPRRRHAKACVSQECLAALAQSYKEQGVTQILTITSGPTTDSPQLFVYDTDSHRAEQRNLDCESCDESQLVTALAEAAGQLAVRCLREHCPPPPRAQAPMPPQAACAPLPKPQCGTAAAVDKPVSETKKPMLARRAGAGVLLATGTAVVAGSLVWSLLSRTSLSQSLIAGKSCDYMNRGALSGSCQITNYDGVDLGGYFVGASAITGGVLLLKLPLERRMLVASAAERK